MASFARRWSPAAAWSVDDASTFAAQKEFKLLQLLSNDKKAFVTARRLGLFCHKPQDGGGISLKFQCIFSQIVFRAYFVVL